MLVCTSAVHTEREREPLPKKMEIMTIKTGRKGSMYRWGTEAQERL